MTRYLISIFVCLILSVTAIGQSYEELIGRADSLYNAKEYSKSTEVFKNAFTLGEATISDLYNGACAASLSGDKKKAYEFLETVFQKGMINIHRLKNDPDLESLHNDSGWIDLITKIQKKVDTLEKDYDKPLQAELLAIYNDDQNIRLEYINALKKLGYKNALVDSLAKIMTIKDSINMTRIAKILDVNGWVGKDKIGAQASQTFFLVIQHSNLKTQEKYLPMMREAVKNGNASKGSLALLEDRIALGQGKRQIYGSQIFWDEKTSQYFVAPLEDPDNVDKRRIEMGLNLLSDYVKQWNIVWNVQEYKKKLPELEILIKK